MFNTKLPIQSELPTSRQLLRSTVIAVGVAAVLLVTVVMPSEYAIDPTGVGRALGLSQMGEIKITLAEEAAADAAVQPVAAPVAQAPAPAQPLAQEQVAAVPVATPVVPPEPALKSDEVTVTLKPGEASEIKLEMLDKATVSYEWTTNGVPVNHDTHGEPYNGPNGYFHSYSKGKQVEGDNGEFTAIFDGTHGWFWRNRSNKDVTITLKTKGEYLSVKRVI
ncbi:MULTISPECIES: transmembrane anchor protein [Pseudomonas]|uniref:Transmembrane anchor protein n=1 Tax=Pseudomonas neustonica TaxID=2487346 RepID=A0ABX9XFL7_9PSED|nr:MULTISPECIES: transmembrane anchor protein [Pseudomonas]MBA6421821.1 transmembrane anchor protein [Pseudomonas sp. 5Ae-yellow]ROZ80248.1 transmembrane anchor protein [Pseudomonas sp. SSM44]ROZ80272.1 transmembrane anchor protein [Pseudomonas neustonica]|tara:strand:+ start:4451 stop:5113 length:663 start_codon:yes stop_codon:yes gene_type:complete